MDDSQPQRQLRQIDALVERLRTVRADVAAMAPRPLAAGALAAFEAEHQVVLPEAYCQLLATLGDGPVAPRLVYGRALTLAACLDDPVFRSFHGQLATPFRYAGERPIALAWDEAADDYVDLTPLDGTLCLGSGGCDEVRVLVVSGSERGRVWDFCPGADHELHPTGMDLLTWCIHWLTAKLREHGVTP